MGKISHIGKWYRDERGKDWVRKTKIRAHVWRRLGQLHFRKFIHFMPGISVLMFIIYNDACSVSSKMQNVKVRVLYCWNWYHILHSGINCTHKMNFWHEIEDSTSFYLKIVCYMGSSQIWLFLHQKMYSFLFHYFCHLFWRCNNTNSSPKQNYCFTLLLLGAVCPVGTISFLYLVSFDLVHSVHIL